MGSHKTKNQLEIELNELKRLYSEKCSECDFLNRANIAKSEASTNACASLKNMGKDFDDARAELKALREGNKKLADQFYDYRSELVKVRGELADAIEKRDSLKVELEGVRGALKRESELRVNAEKERDEYKRDTVRWKTASEDYQNRWHSACRGNECLRNKLNEVEKIQRKHNKLTLEDIDNALRQWDYVNGKLSHDLSMPLESLIQLLDNYGVNDFCKLRERLMYGPTDGYNALHTKRLEKENKDLKAVATDLEGQLRRQTDNCKYWTDRAFRDEEELKKSMEHDRIAQENFEKAARKNDELQNEVNRLYQRWTDTFNPEDELLGRKVLEWQEINVVFAKHNIESADYLDMELEKLKGLDKVCKEHGIESWFDLQKRLDEIEGLRRQSCPEEYMKVFSKYGIDSAEKLDGTLEKWSKVRQCSIALRNNLPYIGNIVDFVDLVKELA